MWQIAVALAIFAAPAETVPHVSCVDGHIVTSLSECPPVQHHGPNPYGGGPVGGGPGRRGLLGLGGIGGIL